VGFSGSVTLEELGIVKILESRGNKVFNQYKSQISREESLEMRRQGAQADYFLSSANAISETGELVFLSAYGHRTAGIAYAKNVIIVCGINKITPTLEEAIKRAREYAMPLNYKRLNWELSKRMCCQTLIIEAEVTPDRPEGRGLASDKPQGNGLASNGQSHSQSHKPQGNGLAPIAKAIAKAMSWKALIQ
jgi:acyl-CoA hydrolase